MEDQLVTVETYQFLPQAQAAKLQLEGNGITVFLADAETVNMDWLLGNAIGNIKLQVPAEQAEHALTILDDMREKARERREAEEEEDDDERVRCLACGAKIPENQTRCPSCGWSYTGEENGKQGAAHEVSGQDQVTQVKEKARPHRLDLIRALTGPMFWFFLLAFLLMAWLLRWLARQH
jgi:hypothetical protein